MRTLNYALLGLCLVLASAVPVLAQGQADGTPPADGHSAANATAMQERHAALVAARQAALDGFHENRTRILQEYNATLHAIRASFLENKTKVLDDCAAKRNETSGNATAQCVKDGLKPLIEQARAGMKDARVKALGELTALRQAALSSFASAKAHADATYGKPSG